MARSPKGWMTAKNAKPVRTATERVTALMSIGVTAASAAACCSECAVAVKKVLADKKRSAVQTRSKEKKS